MAWSFHGGAQMEADALLRSVLAEDEVRSRIKLLAWSAEDAETVLDEELRAGGAVVVIAEDDEAERQALELGATEVVRWPASGRTLAARVRRAARTVRLPWLESVLRMVNDSVEITDSEVHLLEVNPAFERITGYSREEALGKTTGELFRSEKQDPSFYVPIQETIEKGEIWRGQFTAKRQDGSISFQSVAIAEARDDLKRTVGHVAVKRDTSRDDLAWSALENAESRTRTLLERAAEAVLVHGFDGSLADVNPAACRMLGMDRTALLATKVHELWQDSTKEELLEFWASVGADPITKEATWRRADGREVAVELSLARTTISGSELLLMIARDVSEQRDARRRLEELNAQLEETVAERTEELRAALAQHAAVLDNLADGLLAVDASGHVEMWNPALTAMLRGVSEERRHAPVEDVHEGLGGLVRTCIREQAPCEADFELTGERIGRAVVSPIEVDGGDGAERCVGAVLLLRDVTLARQIDRMKTDFIATVSHELRTPLTSVLGFAKLARSRLESRVAAAVDPESKRAQRALSQVTTNLDIIVREGKRLSELIDDVLDISKMEAGRVDWQEEGIDPAALVAQATEVTTALFESNEVRCVSDVSEGLPKLLGDRARLLQVTINLISNAVKFTPEGTVAISARKSPEGVLFAVEDTGVGVPDDQKEIIFEKFRQARDTLTDKPRGTGLGLPICKHIVEHHGGRIWVEDAPAGGSRFAFVIPITHRPSARPSSASPGHPAHTLVEHVEDAMGRKAELLVVDDDEGVRELLRQTLEEAGHTVRTATDGVSAVAQIRERRPDLVILDVLMPGLSGFDVAAMLRSDPDTHDLPIVILSVVADPNRGANLRIDRYLTKPLQQEELLEAISELANGDAVDPPPEYTWVVMRVDDKDE